MVVVVAAVVAVVGLLVAACGGGSGGSGGADTAQAPVIQSANEGEPVLTPPPSSAGGGDASADLPDTVGIAPGAYPTSSVQIEPATTATAAPATPTPVTATGEDGELIAAAKAKYDASRVGTSFASDYVSAGVVSRDSVRLTVCAWDGGTAKDQLLDLNYRVTTDPDTGEVAATYRNVAPAEGDCLNSSLIRSAFDFIGAHDAWLSSVLQNPASFDRAKASGLATAALADRVATGAQAMVDAGTHREGVGFVGNVSATAVREILWRRYDSSAGPVLAIMVCRNMDPRSGMYDNAGLIDDGHSAAGVQGPHSVIEYRLVRGGGGGWKMDAVDSTVWANCFIADDWAAGVNAGAPSSTPWHAVGD